MSPPNDLNETCQLGKLLNLCEIDNKVGVHLDLPQIYDGQHQQPCTSNVHGNLRYNVPRTITMAYVEL